MGELSPAEVAGAFVKSYYLHMCESPEDVHKFYRDSSIVSRRGEDGVMNHWTTLDAIHDHVLSSLDCKDCIIFSTDAQSCIGNGVFVFVFGCVTTKDESIRKFTQSFVLAPMEKPNAFFISNDVLKFLDEEEDPSKTKTKTSIKVNSDLAPDPELDPESDRVVTAKKKSFLTVVNALSSNNAPFKAPPAAAKKSMPMAMDMEGKKIKRQVQVDKKSIFVANLTMDVKVEQLFEAFRKFGAIKADGVKTRTDAKNRCFAFIEFESSISAQNAIQASSIEIGNRKVHIKEKTRNATALGGKHVSQGI